MCSLMGAQSDILLYLIDQSLHEGAPYDSALEPHGFCWNSFQEGWLRMCHSTLQMDQGTWMELPPTLYIQRKHKQ